MVPYRARLNWGLTLSKEHGYHPLKGIPFLTAQVTTLDYVWTGEVYREGGRVRAVWTDPRATDETVEVKWTPSEGWTARGSQSGRRTRPLPKFIAAILCATLIWVYPDILRIALEHAEKANEPTHVYLLLVALTLALVVMIGIYMWFCYKAQPTGLDKVLAGLGRSIGRKDKGEDSTPNTSPDAEAASASSEKADDGGATPQTDETPADFRDTDSASAAPASTPTDAKR